MGERDRLAAGMGERDRLAALLERATRERRGDAAVSGADAVDGATGADGADGADWAAGADWADGADGADGADWAAGANQSDWAERADRADWSGETDGAGLSSGEPVIGGEWLPPDPGRHRGDGSRPPLLALPRSLRSVDLTVRPRAVVALLVVVVAAASVFGLRWWQAEQASAPVPLASRAAQVAPVAEGAGDAATATGVPAAPSSAESGVPGATAASSDAAADGTTSEQAAPAPAALLVHVAGEVRSPAVVRLDPGARVQDAVDAAGGLGADADTSRLNLARAVTDGERIWVPRPGEEVPEVVDPGGASSGAAKGSAGGQAASPPGTGTGADRGAPLQININTADQAVLEELPGVGPVTAGAIIQWRTEHGRFSSPDELLEVSGIGEATLDKLLPHVTL